jgi:hypothetical protein
MPPNPSQGRQGRADAVGPATIKLVTGITSLA